MLFNDSLAAPTFYLVVICGSALILMPYYFVRCYDELILRPEVYCDQLKLSSEPLSQGNQVTCSSAQKNSFDDTKGVPGHELG